MVWQKEGVKVEGLALRCAVSTQLGGELTIAECVISFSTETWLGEESKAQVVAA